MDSITPDRARLRQQTASEIRDSLRELRIQLALLNYRVGANVDLKDVDMDCLDILDTTGPLSPSTLARQAGVHPATMTGILDRLERGHWIVRERDPLDRRAVLVRVDRERYGELLSHYSGLSRAMNKLLAGYADDELKVIADFMSRCVEAGRQASEDLAQP
jgi:DNA-binding MarR family transcriptional regulator